MKKLNLLLIISFVTIIGKAQTLDWAKKFELSATAKAEGTCIFVDNNHHCVYIGGTFSEAVDFDPGPGTFILNSYIGNEDGFLVKLDTSGNFIWALQFGGPLHDVLHGVTVNTHGNIIITGYFKYQMDCDPGPNVHNISLLGGATDMFIISLDSTGSFLWANNYDGDAGDGYGYSLACDSNSNIFISGNPQIVKLDSLGNLLNTISNQCVNGCDILYDKNGFIYICGNCFCTVDFDPGPGALFLPIALNGATGFIVKYDLNLNLIWAKGVESTYGGYSCFYKMVQSDNKDVYLIGDFIDSCDFDPGTSQHLLISNGNADVVLLKLDINGSYLWAKSFGGIDKDFGEGIALSKNGKIYLSGYFIDSVDFDLSTNQQFFYSGNKAGFISVYDTLSNWIQTGILTNGSGYAEINSLHVDQNNYLYGSGYFKGNIDFDINSGTFLLNNGFPFWTVPIFKYEDIAPAVNGNQNKSTNGLIIYPNPSKGDYLVKLNDQSEEIQNIKIIDIRGGCLRNLNGNHISTQKVNLQQLLKGEYIIKLTTKRGNEFTQKIIIN